jgi:TP901 family phage tail tape measure protein
MAGSLPQSGVALIAQNAGAFISQMKGAEGALGAFGRASGGMANIVTGAFRQIGALIINVLASAVRAIGTWIAKSVSVAGDFEQTLNVLGATSGATAAELAQVAKKAIELGADLTLPATSAQDAAQVMLELSKAGFSVQASMDAAKGALQLSAAAQIDGAKAAGIMAGALNAFELPATDAVRIADLLAAGANASSASMTDLAQGMQQAGFAFHAAKMPVEDLVTALAALTNVGLTGSDAGTALKNALMRLMNPTKKAAALMASLGFSAYDATGKMKPMPVLIADINRALAGMTDKQRNAALGTIFLSDGMKAMIPLLSLGADGFLKLKDKVTVAGSAAAVAGAQMKGWNGAVASAQSQMETLQLIIGTFIKDALTPLLFWVAATLAKITDMASRFQALVPEIQNSAQPFLKLLAVLMVLNPSLSGIIGIVWNLYTALSPMVKALSDGSVSGADLQLTLTTLLGPLGATTQAVDAGAWSLQQIWAALQRVGAILSGEVPGALSFFQASLAVAVNVLLATVLPAIATITTWFAANLPAGIAMGKAAFADIGAFITTMMPTIQSIITNALAIIQAFWQQNGANILTIVTGAYTAIKGLIEIVLGAIQGTTAIILGLMTGDWQAQMGTIQSSNTTIWNGIRTFLGGILNAIAGLFGTTLDGLIALWESNFRKMADLTTRILAIAAANALAGVLAIKGYIDSEIGRAVALWNGLFGEIKSTVESVMTSADSIVSSTLSSISGAFHGIIGSIHSAIQAVKDFIDTVSKIHVPDLITPGSPTPLEIGMRGIGKATNQAAAAFKAQFTPALANIPALQPTMTGGATTNTTYGANYTMPIYTNQSPAVLSQSLALIEAMTA